MMGLLSFLRARATGAATAKQQPQGTLPSIFYATEAGAEVSEDSAMRFATVQACVRVLAEDISSLPLHVYERIADGGKQRAREHPLYALLHDQPNSDMTSCTMRCAMMVNVLLYGNAYAFIEFNRRGEVIGLWPLPAGQVEPRRENGQIVYWIGQQRYSASEILHLSGLSFDGLVGLSPIAYARETIGLGVAAESFGRTFFKNGTHLGGTVTVPNEMSDQAFERLSLQFKELYKGGHRAHGVPILEAGATYTSTGIPPDDAQFLETRKYQRTDIAAIFRVPPHMIGDLERATFSNIEHQDISYLQRGLLPWLTRWEQELRRKVLTGSLRERYVVEHDTDGFMRGDTASRMKAYALAIQSGIMSPNEARARENLNPVEGGDTILLPMNMARADLKALTDGQAQDGDSQQAEKQGKE